MTSKWLGLAFQMASFACHDALAAPMPTKADWDPNDTAPTYAAVEASTARLRAERCDTPSCQGLQAIDTILRIADFVDDNEEMGTARILYSPARIRRRLDRALFGRPALYAPFCRTTAAIFHRVPLAPDIATRWLVVTLLVAGTELDLHDRDRCVPAMIKALPRSAAIADLRHEADVECENPIAGLSRSKATCPSLVEGFPARKG